VNRYLGRQALSIADAAGQRHQSKRIKDIKTFFKTTVLLVALSVSGAVGAQAPGSYEHDVGTIYGAVRGIKQVREICATVFPDDAETSLQALSEWRDKYRDFIIEIEAHFLHMVSKQSGKDDADYKAALIAFETEHKQRTAEIIEQMVGENKVELSTECEKFPSYLESDEANFEDKFTDQIERIRKQYPRLPKRRQVR
jgi:hypothetical protein